MAFWNLSKPFRNVTAFALGGPNPLEQVKDVARFLQLTGFSTELLGLLISSERKFDFRLKY